MRSCFTVILCIVLCFALGVGILNYQEKEEPMDQGSYLVFESEGVKYELPLDGQGEVRESENSYENGVILKDGEEVGKETHVLYDINSFKKIQPYLPIVDVRTQEEFREGHLPGADNLPLDQIEEAKDRYKDYKVLVVHCRSGARSANAAKKLIAMGFDCVVDLGGLLSYRGELE